MRFDEFMLDRWLQEKSGPGIHFDFGGSTGPVWRLRDVLALDGPEAAERLLELQLVYSRTAGAEDLRCAIAEMVEVPFEHVVVLSGASECLAQVFMHAAEQDGNVVVPFPCYPTQAALPKAFGLEVRSYPLRREAGFRPDLDEIAGMVDGKTRVLLANVPHNPTGAVLTDADLVVLRDLADRHGAQFVCDEVHRPVFHGPVTGSAARLLGATAIGDFSKAFALPGLRLGWIIEPNARRRAAYGNAREYFTVTNSPLTEAVAEIAVRHRDMILSRTGTVAAANLAILHAMFERNADRIGWIKPGGGMTGFPWLHGGGDMRALCLAAVGSGILLVPGDCVGVPDHMRIGFGAQDTGFEEATAALENFLRGWQE